jgi:hypothetical protein
MAGELVKTDGGIALHRQCDPCEKDSILATPGV